MDYASDAEIELALPNDDRFAGQKRIKWWNQDILKESRILVIGAGTLGNEICKNLALLGIGHVTIIDNDEVDEVNLSRSVLMRDNDCGMNKAMVVARRMNELYKDMITEAINLNVVYEYGACNYKNFNLVMTAVDNLEARIQVNKYCHMWKIPLIDGGLDGLLCNVQVIIPFKTHCFECTLGDGDYEKIRKRYSCDHLRRIAPEKKIPMVVTSAAIAAGLMTQEAVKLLHNIQPILAGKKAYIDGNTNSFQIFSVPMVDDCPAHHCINSKKISVEYSNKIKLSDLKERLKERLGSDVDIKNDQIMLYGFSCPSCGSKVKCIKPSGLSKENELTCKHCNKSSMKPDLEISGLLKEDDLTLEDHGIPENHVLEIETRSGEHLYLLPSNY